MKKGKFVIVGNGVAGTTVALELQRLAPKSEITMISGESEYHFSRPALMYTFMGHMRYQDTMPYPESFWKKQKIKLKKAWVSQINTSAKKVVCDDGDELAYDKLILATGSKSNKFGWPGQDLDGVQGFYNLFDLDLLEGNIRNARSAVIVGGGLIGIELAEMLHQRGIPTTFLVREDSYWNNILLDEESAIINQLIRQEGIDLRLSTNLKEIIDNGNGRCRAVLTEFDEEIPADIVGLTAGVSPNVQLAKTSGIETGRGIIVDPFFASPTEDVFAIGDCAEITQEGERGKVDQLWYTGKMQGKQLARNLVKEKIAYEKPIFYNSAKFFDLEYQVYGDVFRGREGEDHIFWQSEDNRHFVRLVSKDGIFAGINSMGIRYRHRTCEAWLADKVNIGEVIERLPEANFDPEFYKRYEKEMIPKLKAQLK